MIPYDLRRTAVWNFERTDVSRSVAMQLTERVLSAAWKSSANSRRGQFRGQKGEGAELRESVKH